MDDRIAEIREVVEALRLTPGSGDPLWKLVDPADLEQAILHLGAYADLLDSDALIIRRDEDVLWSGRLCLQHLADAGDDSECDYADMGGSKYANRAENCIAACSRCHDVLDGRTSLGTQRFELNEMLRRKLRGDKP